MESDIVWDVRFLPNPYFVEELKLKDGRDPEVADWVLGHEVTLKFLEKLEDLLVFLYLFTYGRGSSTLPSQSVAREAS